MKRFIETRFFLLMQTSLHENYNLSLIEDAYDKFAGILFLERYQTLDLNIFYNTVCYTQVEFKQLHNQLTNKKKRDCNRVLREGYFTR
ncbi:MAG: hypothetical protein LBE13_17845 [Bacteroidales bacterium]|jgi:hypothetical protein|nr:hypothetical protein [Bacteroidales bacterium]